MTATSARPYWHGPIVIEVLGRPITQGSKVRTRWGMRDASEQLRPWRDNVRSAAVDVLDGGPGWGAEPVNVTIVFAFARPMSHYRTGKFSHELRDAAPPYPSTHGSGDLDKLVRAVGDSLTDAGVWRDDSQIAELHARKVWAHDHQQPGVLISVATL